MKREETKQPSEATYRAIDHIAIAVRELEPAIAFYTEVLGFTLVRRLKIVGKRTGMISAEMEHHGLKFVLCQGTEPESQVSRLIENFGPGVAHIALAVDDIHSSTDRLKAQGMEFDTTIIDGAGLKQIFSKRDPNSGMSFEIIQRTGEVGFLDDNVQELFAQLERNESY